MGSIVEGSGETRLQVSPLWVNTPTSRLISKRSPCLFLFKRKIGSGDSLSGKPEASSTDVDSKALEKCRCLDLTLSSI